MDDELTEDILSEFANAMEASVVSNPITTSTSHPATTTTTTNHITTTATTSDATSASKRVPLTNLNAIIVRPTQKGNKVLSYIKNTVWEYGDVVADYVVGRSNAVLYLSLQYHAMYPEYIYARIRDLGRAYTLRVLLLLVDVPEGQHSINELSKIAVVNELTLMLAWSHEEAARYLETYKTYENKPPDQLQSRHSEDYLTQLTTCLTTVRAVNKTDVVTLVTTFGSLAHVANAGMDELRLCPGMGDLKAQRLQAVFTEPFIIDAATTKRSSKGSKNTSSTTENVTTTPGTASTEEDMALNDGHDDDDIMDLLEEINKDDDDDNTRGDGDVVDDENSF